MNDNGVRDWTVILPVFMAYTYLSIFVGFLPVARNLHIGRWKTSSILYK